MAVVRIEPAGNRIHVGPHEWLTCQYATDYWLAPTGAGDLVAASGATNISGLDSYGWTTTSLAVVAAVTGDFLSSADDVAGLIRGDAASDLIASPGIFGNGTHQLLVSKTLGFLPDKLIAEWTGAFTVASANEATTYMGFHNGAAITMAIISDSSTFLLSNGVSTDAGAAVDNAVHTWKIEISKAAGTATWYIDGTSQGTLAITQDVWPAAFICAAGTTNRWTLAGYLHIYYE